MNRVLYASTKNSDMLYAVKQVVSDPSFLIEQGNRKYLFIDRREYDVFLSSNNDTSITPVLLDPLLEEAQRLNEDTTLTNKLALLLFKKYKLLKDPAHVPVHFPLDMADFLRSKKITLIPEKAFYPQRECKTDYEVAQIEGAITRTKKAYKRIEEMLRGAEIRDRKLFYNDQPLTSEWLKNEAEIVLAREGLMSTEGMIISCGREAAIPHHSGEGVLLAHQTIICDLFPRDRITGYFADMTRTYVKGKASKKIKSLYQAVLEAQQQALEMLKAGVSSREVHQRTNDSFLQAGYDVGDKGFIHGTGHGLGLDIHESPAFNDRSDALLEAGNVMTVEPGLYYPSIGGVRIEDVVVVTKTGCRNLTNYPKKLVIA